VLVLGVDGGGTKTEAWIAQAGANESQSPKILGRGLSGCSNPRAVGMPQAQAAIQTAIDEAWVDAAVAGRVPESAVFALAGSGQKAIREEILAWAEQVPLADTVEIVHDALPVLAAGTPDSTGIALIAGTGSSALARDDRGRTWRAGGWGWRLGDEGGGYWIGCEALRAVTHAVDGRGPSTELSHVLRQHYQVSQLQDLPAKIEATGDARQAIAGLCPVVLAAAERGDGVACAIAAAATGQLASLVECLAPQLDPQGFCLALAGGVLCGTSIVADLLIAELGEREIAVREVTPVPHPVAGCVLLAQRRAMG
jgi:N-acetylglucosamine kinase-like BadF-type ATPase